MKKLLLMIVWVFFAVLSVSPAMAAKPTFEFDQDNFFLQTSGQNKVSETVLIKNQTEKPLKITLSWKEFAENSHSLDFANLSTAELDLQPFGVSAVEITMTIPATLKSGDYYGDLLAQSEAETKKTAFTLRFLGTLTQKVHLQETGFDGKGLKLAFENQGNISSNVSGKITVTNFFGGVVAIKEIQTFDLKASEKLVKSFSIGNLLPGPYQAKIELLTGEKQVNQSSVASFWVLPVGFFAVLLVLIISILVATILIWRKLHA